MHFKLFQYSLDNQPSLDELNRYLDQNRVVSVQKELIQCRGEPQLIFIVETTRSNLGENTVKKPPCVDYKEILDADEFIVFCQLRDCRKQLAESEGVPVFTVFTNAQLASMVSNRCNSLDSLANVSGIGQARVSKYGEAVLAILVPACDSLLNKNPNSGDL